MADEHKKQKLQILGELTAVVAHELKNPLGTIRNSLFLIENRLNDEYVVDEFIDNSIARVLRNIDRCNSIVDDLLDYTRHSKLMKRKTNIKELLDSSMDDIVCPPTVKINNQIDPTLTLSVDPDRMHRVFLNLLKNSIEAIMDCEVGIGAGYINITNKLENCHHILSFYDNGPGVSQDMCEKLFEPLISTKSFGIGLGLSIVQDIMKKHQGHAEMTGELDKFTQVNLVFKKNS